MFGFKTEFMVRTWPMAKCACNQSYVGAILALACAMYHM